jgi:hypothetical protein
MRLNVIRNLSLVSPILLEGYGRVLDLDYPRWKTDPDPRILLLGRWRDPRTGRRKIGGINLNYLSQNQIDKLRYYLPEILSNKNLMARYYAGRELVPDVFMSFYRDYYDNMEPQGASISGRSTLKFLTPSELMKQGKDAKSKELQQRRDELRAKQYEQEEKRKAEREAKRAEREAKRAERDAGRAEREKVQRREVEVPSPEEEVPEDPVAARAKETVDAKQEPRLATNIDRRMREIPDEVPEEPEEVPEVPEEPEEEPEEFEEE